MKRRPVVVEQTCAACDVSYVGYATGFGAGRSTVLRSGSEAAMVPAKGGCVVTSGGDLLFGRRFLGPRWESLVLEQGTLELRGGPLKLVRRRSCSALSAATWRERPLISCRSAVMLGVDQR
jgi:hypothetical protein